MMMIGIYCIYKVLCGLRNSKHVHVILLAASKRHVNNQVYSPLRFHNCLLTVAHCQQLFATETFILVNN